MRKTDQMTLAVNQMASAVNQMTFAAYSALTVEEYGREA